MAKIALKRKKELREPDEFITWTSRMLEYVLRHKVKIAGAVGAILLIISAFSLFVYSSNQKEEKAFVAYHELTRRYESLLGNNDAQKAFRTIRNDFESFLQDYSKTVAGSMAAVRFGSICFDGGAYDQAVKWDTIALDAFMTDDYENILLSALGHAYIGQKDYARAVSVFERITANDHPLMQAEAFYLLGVLYELTDRREKSTEAYKTVVSKYPDSMFFDMAKGKTING